MRGWPEMPAQNCVVVQYVSDEAFEAAAEAAGVDASSADALVVLVSVPIAVEKYLTEIIWAEQFFAMSAEFFRDERIAEHKTPPIVPF